MEVQDCNNSIKPLGTFPFPMLLCPIATLYVHRLEGFFFLIILWFPNWFSDQRTVTKAWNSNSKEIVKGILDP